MTLLEITLGHFSQKNAFLRKINIISGTKTDWTDDKTH